MDRKREGYDEKRGAIMSIQSREKKPENCDCVHIGEGVLQDWLRNVRALWVSKWDSESRTEMQIVRGENACPIVLQSMVDRTADLCSQQAIEDVKRRPIPNPWEERE